MCVRACVHVCVCVHAYVHICMFIITFSSYICLLSTLHLNWKVDSLQSLLYHTIPHFVCYHRLNGETQTGSVWSNQMLFRNYRKDRITTILEGSQDGGVAGGSPPTPPTFPGVTASLTLTGAVEEVMGLVVVTVATNKCF